VHFDQDSLLFLPESLPVPLEEVHVIRLIILSSMIVIRGVPVGTIVTISSELQLHLLFLNYQGLSASSRSIVLLPRGDSLLLFLSLLHRFAHGHSQLVPEGLHEVLEHGIPQEFRPAKGRVGATRTLVPKVVKGRTGPRKQESRLRDALVEGRRGWKVIVGSFRTIPLAILVKYVSAVHYQLIPGLSPLLTAHSRNVVRLRVIEWRPGSGVPILLIARLQARASVPCPLDIPMVYPPSRIVFLVLVHPSRDLLVEY
jgi:hypothetical protein